MENRERLVVLMDIFLGNTAVLMDRDPRNAERRKFYGRAGEHRLPGHGIEYRTLSNFWLRAWPLMSGVLGISRFTCNVLANTLYANTYGGSGAYYKEAESEILSKVDVDAIITAINNNDVKLAKKNWAIVRDYIVAHYPNNGGNTGLHAGNVEAFDYMVSKIDSDGIEYWFPKDPMVFWTEDYFHTTSHSRCQDGSQVGWESFLDRVVGQEMRTGKHIVRD
jgi:hypothetical protein